MSKHLQLITCFVLGMITCDAQNKTLTDFLSEGSVLFKKYTGGLKNNGLCRHENPRIFYHELFITKCMQ